MKKSKSSISFWYFVGLLIGFIIIAFYIQVLLEPQKSKVDEWFDDYSLSDCEENVKSKLRDPDSYEKIQMLLPTRVNDKKKILRWDFRAKNGFSGYNVLTAECIVKKQGNGSILTSTKELN